MTPPAVVNFKALADSEKLHPPVRTRQAIEQGEEKFERFKFKPGAIPPGAPVSEIPSAPHLKSLQNSSPPVLSFNGIQDYGIFIPPDIQGAAGTTYIMETTNQEFDVYDKTGTLVEATSLGSFFHATHGSHFFDPHIVFDPQHNRFISCCTGNYLNGNGGLFIGVSATGDPTGNWYLYSFDAALNNTDFIDYPEIGFNSKWVVLTANDFNSDTTAYARVYVLRSDSLYMGNPGSVKYFSDTSAYTIVPAQTYDTMQGTAYLVEDANGNHSGNGYMQIETITGPVDSPVYSTGHHIGVNQPWSENPVKAVQDGGDNSIEDGDTRVMNGVTYSNGSLWFTHNVFLPADTPTHTAVDWWQINPDSLTVQQFGRLEDPTGNTYYYYPSLALNAHNDMVLGYCISSRSYYPSAAYSFRFSTDVPNTLRSSYIYKYGQDSYDKTFGAGRNRWGDFTGTTVDPVDGSFWNFNEYAGITNSWATAIAHIADGIIPCKAHADFIYSGSLSCSVPFTVNFTNLSTSAGVSTWDFGDGTTAQILNPLHSYFSYGLFTVKLTVSDSVCGLDSITKTDIVQIRNEVPVIHNTSCCRGQSATLATTSPGLIYWYNNAYDNSPVDSGASYLTPPLSDTTTFYAEARIPGALTSCGPVTNNFGPGQYFGTNGKQHLVVFDCKYPQKLLSVDVYSQGSGYRNIVLMDPNNTILQSSNTFLHDGLNTVNLNFDIPIDHDLKLTTQDSIDFYYNSSGATYPYYSSDSTVVLIHSDDVHATDYFYFYNWKLQGSGCLSNRVAAQVSVVNPQNHFDYNHGTGNSINFIPANARASSCQWLFGDGAFSGQMNASHTYAAPGIYPVRLIEQIEGCTDTLVQPVEIPATGNVLDEVQSLFVFPNPANNQLNLQVGIKQSSTWNLTVEDVAGQTLIKNTIQLNPGLNNLLLNVSTFAGGEYFVSLRNGKMVATRRFVKE